MNLLLDTHVLLWWADEPSQLSAIAQAAILDPQNTVFVSAATVWEIVIKQGLGKLDAPDDLAEMLRQCRFTALGISVEHTLVLRSLPMHHRDPFDRILVAQSLFEGLTIVTRDPLIQRYTVANLPA